MSTLQLQISTMMSIDDEKDKDNNNCPQQTPPIDKWHLVQIVFFLHGISALLPWNMLINANSYFVDYKLHPDMTNVPVEIVNCVHNGHIAAASAAANFTLDDSLNETTTISSSATYNLTNVCKQKLNQQLESTELTLQNYRQNFLPYLSTASKFPNIIFQLVNLLFSSSYRASSNRLMFSFIVEIVLFLVTIALALLDTSSWPKFFFWITIISAVLFNTVNGIFQSCIYGIGAKFPLKYINAITVGFSFSGSIASIFLIISLLLSPHPKVIAIYYFTFATVFMCICMVNEIVIRRNPFLKYHVRVNEFNNFNRTEVQLNQTEFVNHNAIKASTGDITTDTNNNGHTTTTTTTTENNSTKASSNLALVYSESESEIHLQGIKAYLFIWNRSWIQLLNIALIYFVSFAIFPAVQADIRPLNSLVSEKFFTPIFCFLFFNSWATLGNFFAEKVLRPSPGSLLYWTIARFVFIPFFLLCNYLPDRRIWPVLVGHDIIYAFGSATMAFTSGYLSALGMMYAPGCVPSIYSSTASMMASASVIIGILGGVQFSILLQHVVTSWHL